MGIFDRLRSAAPSRPGDGKPDTAGQDATRLIDQGHALEAQGKLTVNAATVSEHYDLMLAGDGVLGLKETTTPTADTNYGKVYCKDDNKLYFQDGAGNEHEIAFVP